MAATGKIQAESGPYSGGGEEAGHGTQEVSQGGEGAVPLQWTWGAQAYS